MAARVLAFALAACGWAAVLVTPAPAANLLVNPGAEATSLTPWYDTLGNGFGVMRTPDILDVAYEGTATFYGGCNGPIGAWVNELAQDVDLAGYAEDIDAGRAHARFAGWERSSTNGTSEDQAEIRLEFFDERGGLAAGFTSVVAEPPGTWVHVEDMRALPVGTRSVRVLLKGWRSEYSCTDALFDALSFEIESSTPALPVTWARVRCLYR